MMTMKQKKYWEKEYVSAAVVAVAAAVDVVVAVDVAVVVGTSVGYWIEICSDS